MREAAWPVLQAAVAAGVAWALALVFLDNPQPVFAPTAAVVALAARVGGRGTQAAEMLVGVAVGVGVGALLVLVLETGTVQIALAAAVAMLVVAAISNGPLPLIQAGGTAVLVIALQTPGTGSSRVLEALVGGGVALVVSQVLLSPNPVSLLASSERRVLAMLEGSLNRTADALASCDAAAAEATLKRLRTENRDALCELESVRETSKRISRRTLRGRFAVQRLERLEGRLQSNDLLLESVLLLSHATSRLLGTDAAENPGVPEAFSVAARTLARGVAALREDPGVSGPIPRAHEAAREVRKTLDAEHFDASEPRLALVADELRRTASAVAALATPGG
ncbi:Fusaric acid resistance protein-like [Rubrobacter radiotolerans]|uniref:Fusaric acid resistance protein-like n=1 Tax=Rubrobacter radiotolerans TaxID=42256 RepID=A0A023X559_RUBRA|nr:Fusaric acid resistance protein-like [Rubrobacter radiotolerans]